MGKIIKAVQWFHEMELSGLHIAGVCPKQIEARSALELDYYVKTPAGDVDLYRGDLVATDDMGQKYVFMPRLPRE